VETAALNPIADAYVRLVLAVGVFDPDYVDAFYGPAAWKAEAEERHRPLPEIRREAEALLRQLRAFEPPAKRQGGEPDGVGEIEEIAEIAALRHAYLSRQLEALTARVDQLSGRKLTFDEESRALYDATAPVHTEAHFQGIRDRLDAALPGEGSLEGRLEDLRSRLAIPVDRLTAVFDAAIAECRRRTLVHIDLPESESFAVELVQGRPWSAYNWYQGGYHSLIQVNSELPITIDRAVDLACHEGYPGHHVYNVLLERRLVRERGWNEYTVYPLFSPQSLIAEGTANFGIEVTFPGAERLRFDTEVLYPLAGLDAALAPAYQKVLDLLQGLGYAGNEAARGYLDGMLDREEAERWLVRYALMAPERAAQRIGFFERYRSYLLNYNLGQDLVRSYIEGKGGTPDRPDVRWRELEKLISSPRLPSGLR
jgi:hypothetical protein